MSNIGTITYPNSPFTAPNLSGPADEQYKLFTRKKIFNKYITLIDA